MPFSRGPLLAPPLSRPTGGPSLVIWLRPLEATMPFYMVPAPPQSPEVGPPGPFEFCVWRQPCPFPEVHCWPPPLPPGGPSLVIWRRPLEATVPISMVPVRPGPLRLASQAPEIGHFKICVWKQLCPFFRGPLFVHCCPRPLPRPPGGPSLVIWLRPLEATMPFSKVPAPTQAPEVGPQAPEFGSLEILRLEPTMLFSRDPLLAMRRSPGPQVAPVKLFG